MDTALGCFSIKCMFERMTLLEVLLYNLVYMSCTLCVCLILVLLFFPPFIYVIIQIYRLLLPFLLAKSPMYLSFICFKFMNSFSIIVVTYIFPTVIYSFCIMYVCFRSDHLVLNALWIFFFAEEDDFSHS